MVKVWERCTGDGSVSQNKVASDCEKISAVIEHHWQDGQLYLILCGSSMSFMEYQVLGYESPLYGVGL